jgi:hypothetical protein
MSTINREHVSTNLSLSFLQNKMSVVDVSVKLAEGIFMPKKKKLADVVMGNMKQEDGTVLRDVNVKDFNLNQFRSDGCIPGISWFVITLLTFSYFWAIVSDGYTVYGLAVNQAIPKRICYAYLAFFLLGLIIFLMEVSYAKELLSRGDLSQMMLDDLTRNMFQSRGLCEYGLIGEIQKTL